MTDQAEHTDGSVAVQAGGDDTASQEPDGIWAEGVEEGERRLERRSLGALATALVGGFDVMLGVAAATVVAGAAAEVLPAKTASVVGALAFGIGFVFITIGRSELFSENFLIPVSAVVEGRSSLT